MQKKAVYLLALISSMSFFTSCKDDDNKIVNATDWTTEIVGSYKGNLAVAVEGADLGNSTQVITLTRQDENVAKLELKDFIITLAGAPIKVGDITVQDIRTEGTESKVELAETATVINHPTLGQLDVKTTGTIADKTADLRLAIYAATLRQNIDVTFKGVKTDDLTDNTDYAADLAAWYKRESLTITGDTVDSRFPNDGLSVVYRDVNTIAIESFYLSFPANVQGASTTRKIPTLDSIPLIKGGNGLIIDTMRIEVAPQQKQDTAHLVVSGTLVGKILTLHMNLSTQNKKADYVFVGAKKLTGASISKITIDSDVVALQPEIEQNDKDTKNVMIYVKPNTPAAQLTLVPEFEVSEGATVTFGGQPYVAGTPVDFSKECKFDVKSQSGTTNYTYVVKTCELKTDFDFATGLESWETQNETTDPEQAYLMYDEPANGWATSNGGVYYIKLLFGDMLYGKNAPYVVEQTSDAKSGAKAAKLTTIHTTGINMEMAVIPAVTSATVFSGTFEADMKNALRSTKFGYPCFKKPVSLSGSYKYTPGETYLYCPDPIKNADKVEEVKTKTDAPAINAVLFEVDSYAFDFLDGTNLLTSHRIVARASLKNPGTPSSYQDFNLSFEWLEGKNYDASKKYKLAVVCSSSKDGDKFSGAPGSVLYIDNLKVTFQ